ncbi:nitrogenase iron-molybdenum cofactor biosynthesis protein NifE [Gorillibacterium massiliense]|uniref:nitrogenase iron-molybdenum cofactor biosynthesis protein NifE n=1 Tax=Gorillibacterium massiliense TaxID=1280390 RepID=UPI0004BA5516|nr:nitrogenase iron-molybdenum cofactor biosynthesis protein NifE [Gorillibacterium massiliense]
MLLNEKMMTQGECLQNQKKPPSCPRPKPGEAAGGCTFDGAQITLLPIADAAHLVHGPIGCSGNSWEWRGSLSSGPFLSRFGMTTDLGEQDIIFGGEKKLRRAIGEIIERYSPPAVFVYATCVTALIGDDLEAVCKSESQRWSIPVIPVNSPGFLGNKNLGNRLAGDALFEHVIGTAEPEEPLTPYDINLIGEYNIAGELWDINELFGQVGIRVLSRITGDGRFQEVRYAHRAKVNMVVCSRAMIGLAKNMRDKYGIPFFEGSFYGARETAFSLRQIAYLLGDRALEIRVEQLIKREERRLERELAEAKSVLRGKRVVLYTGGVKSWSVITALQELGIKVVGVGTNKSSREDVSRIKERVTADTVLIDEGGAARILKTVRDKKADMIIAGGRNMFVALKEQIPYLDINQERHTAYAGYKGLTRLANHLVESLTHPVWEAAKRRPPWEGVPPYGHYAGK